MVVPNHQQREGTATPCNGQYKSVQCSSWLTVQTGVTDVMWVTNK